MVKMRDGILLETDIYYPNTLESCPVILIRTPYNKLLHKDEAMGWVNNKFAFVVQDVRGKFNSQGEWEPYENEINDGFDTVEWIFNQKWAQKNNIIIKGASYQAFTAFAAAQTNHPSIRTIITYVPAMGLYESTFTPDGILYLFGRLSWNFTHGTELESRKTELFNEIIQTNPKTLLHLPVVEMDKEIQFKINNWSKHISEIKNSTELKNKTSIKLENINIPVLHIGGLNDPFIEATINNFTKLKDNNQSQKLIVGPWTHDVNQGTSLGFRNFSKRSILDLASIEINWIKSCLQEKDINMDERVLYFIMGSNKWLTSETWPPNHKLEKLYFSNSENALVTFPKNDVAQNYYYNPEKPVPSLIGPVDQSKIQKRNDVIVYSSEPFDKDINIVGSPKVNLFVNSSATNTDFIVKLNETLPNGQSILITYGAIRTSFDNKPYPKQIKINLNTTSLTIKKGSILTVEITSSFFPYMERNLNTGRDNVYEKEPIIAKQSIYTGITYPSNITLPILIEE
ncbi:CocE/NonD family hydrolase [Bacillus sp. JJ1562]|uniref:CocE/NonD family hydrolase n=1 Tax=Bacillus sp. JJ1562 TaxID=3122960 RepID=UPI00300141A4